MTEEREWLKRCEVFAELEDEALERFAAGATWRRYAAGDVLVAEMQENDEIFLLVEGQAVGRFILTGPDNRQAFAEWGPGDLAGVAAFVTRIPHPGTITAETDVTALVWPASFWRAEAERDPAVGYRLAMGAARILVDRTVEWSLNLLDRVSWGLE